MPRKVDHRARRETIARALWQVVEQRGLPQATMRDVASQANVSLGQVQHYFSSRSAMLTFAMDFASEQTAQRVAQGLQALGQPPHPQDVLRLTLSEMLPLHPDSRATSRMSAAYVLEALHVPELRDRVSAGLRDGRTTVEQIIRLAIADGHIAADRDPVVETDLLLALTGFTTLLDLQVIGEDRALAAIDQYLDRLFTREPPQLNT